MINCPLFQIMCVHRVFSPLGSHWLSFLRVSFPFQASLPDNEIICSPEDSEDNAGTAMSGIQGIAYSAKVRINSHQSADGVSPRFVKSAIVTWLPFAFLSFHFILPSGELLASFGASSNSITFYYVHRSCAPSRGRAFLSLHSCPRPEFESDQIRLSLLV